MQYKPDGYSSVSPYLVVNGAQKAIDFLSEVFDAQALRMQPAENGKLAHAELRIDDTVLMFCDAMEGWPAIPSHVHIYVPDVDITFQRALDAGAEAIQAPVKGNDQDKRGGFRDASGITWWIGTQVE